MTQVTHEQMLQNILTFGAFGGMSGAKLREYLAEFPLIQYESALARMGLSDKTAALVYVAAAILSALPACYFLGGAYGWFAGDCAFTLVTLGVVLASAYLDGRP